MVIVGDGGGEVAIDLDGYVASMLDKIGGYMVGLINGSVEATTTMREDVGGTYSSEAKASRKLVAQGDERSDRLTRSPSSLMP